MNPKQQIAAAILSCALARDGRGRWRQEERLAKALGGSPLDKRVAEAANRIGTLLASFPLRPERSGARGGADVSSSSAPTSDLSAGVTPPRAGSLSTL